jgi:tRNA dimethylallyltransferase
MSRAPFVVAVVGPTATGKSALSLDLADALDGEIINVDSMQLYRGMDIGTAKLAAAQRRGIPHHLLDIWPVTKTASVAEYQQLARAAIAGIADRGRLPILVGGSGLYVRATLEHFDFPGTDEASRARLEAELSAVGPAPLYSRLADLDPEAAAKILPTNGRRIVRALEVISLTGQPFTASLPDPTPLYPHLQLGVDRAPAVLDQLVADRVAQMFRQGLVAEVEGLIAVGLRQGRTAARALGYQQVLAMLDGEIDLDQAVRETVQATRRFVRRQRTWFRRDPTVMWLDGDDPQGPAKATHAIRAALRERADAR